jgi:dihydrofolate synthase/folylpolyglutamate synthase
MNYAETIQWLYAQLPMFSKTGAAAYKGDLNNIRQLCAALGHPERRFPTVHIAGTNGKGSVSHMLASILQAAGYKTGLYTSPHLRDFRERIRINGHWVSEDFVIRFTERCIPLVEAIQPSFFELTVAMAFEWFAENEVDLAVIETGLGGRLDSTNVIVPELSVITNIGWDHMQILGDTLPKIAAEKAGIIKPGVPVVIGETHPETREVFLQKTAETGSSIVFADQVRQPQGWSWKDGLLKVSVCAGNNSREDDYMLDLPGLYQVKNLLTVLASTDQLRLRGWVISDQALADGLHHAKSRTGLGGRWEILHRHPLIVADVAHNPDGIREVLKQLEATAYGKLHMVLGMVRDKDVQAVLALLPKDATYYFTRASVPRAMPEDKLREAGATHDLKGNEYLLPNDALQAAVDKAEASDLILVCGSIFLVGEVDIRQVRFQ